jgi:mannose-1-phosphate guanylyltransferase
MQALILAGGKGTRLRPLTNHTPKPVVPICNRPFLLYQLDVLREAGITDVTLSLSYQPQRIEQLLGDGSDFGVHLKYTVEPQPMGTAGAYKFAAEHIRETTIVFNGDVLTDLNLERVIREHQKRNAAATIVLTPVEDPSAYGVVETDDEDRVSRFIEKPKPGETIFKNINAGTYILDPRVLDFIPAGKSYSFEYDFFPDLLRRGEAFFAHIPKKEAYWLDIGTPARYLKAHHDLLGGHVKRIKIPGGRNFSGAEQVEIDSLSLIADGCTIKPGAQIIKSVLGEGCMIEEKARIENSVLWPHTRVASSAHVSFSIIGQGCHVGREASAKGSVLGDKTVLTDFTQTGELL